VPKVIKRNPQRDARIEAVQLLGKWTQLAQGHVLVGGGGCSCGLVGANLRIEDFEEQILDYLRGKHGEAVKSDRIATLLQSIARPASGEAGKSLALLDDLGRTLDSFDQLHRTR
jgi:hypothetical protein